MKILKCNIIFDEFAEKDNRIIVIYKKIGGVYEARNVGMEKAIGEYMCIIDGDDWLEPDYVEYLMKLIYETKSELAMTDRINITFSVPWSGNGLWFSSRAAHFANHIGVGH